MTSKKAAGYVSVLATNYLEPIATLLKKLESLNPGVPNQVQALFLDNGYSVSIIILAVLLLESATGRTQYIRDEKSPKKPVDFVRSAFPESGFADDLEELFVVRDVIAHNHIWEGQFEWDEQAGMKWVSPPELHSGGDAKFRKVINPKERKTRQLGINLFPTRICRADAVMVLKKVVEFLLFLESQDRNYIYLSPQLVEFDRGLVRFTDIVAKL